MRSRLKSALNNLNEERGMILPTVFVLLLLLAILIPPMMDLVGTGMVSGNMYEDKSQELYAADAGANDALWLLAGKTQKEMNDLIALTEDDGDPEAYIYKLPGLIDNTTVRCEITQSLDGETYVVKSTATGLNGSSTTVEVWASHPESIPTVNFSTGALNGEVLITGELGSAEFPVNVYANGNIDIQGSGVCYGDVYHTPDYELIVDESSATFVGKEFITRPLQIASDYMPEKPGNEIEINDNINTSRELGDVYIKGDINIGGSAVITLTGTVWVEGTISIGGSARVEGEGPDGEYYFMIAENYGVESCIADAINFQAGFARAILYSPHTSIFVAGSANLEGAAVAYCDVTIMGSANLVNAIPLEQVPIGSYPMTIGYWKIY